MTAENILERIVTEVGLDIPNAQLSNDDYEMRKLRRIINEAGEDVAKRAPWARLIKEINVPPNTSEMNLPDDFYEIAQSGGIRLNGNEFKPVRPIVAPLLWAFLAVHPSSQPYYHIHDGKILFAPQVNHLGAKMKYKSKQWIQQKDEITENGDQVLIPERLIAKGAIWRWKRQQGMPFEDLLAEFEADLNAEIKADRGSQ